MEKDIRTRAQILVKPGKGILAADESIPTIGKRLRKYCIENTEGNRRDYRELFFTAPGINEYLSGCILFKETLYQSTADGKAFVDVLRDAGLLVGIKVDEGLEPLEGCEGESHTKGLENLRRNCREYARQGAAFTKWRAAFNVQPGKPSAKAVEVNAAELAAYASVSQAIGLVPIVEPEILIDGTHSLQQSAQATSHVLKRVVEKLEEQKVDLQGCLLKIQMVVPGSEGEKVTSQEIAEATISTLSSCLPESIAGVVFLSGGQSEEEATSNLNAIVRQAKFTCREGWGLSFSYGRSLQASVLDLWSKDRAGVQAAKEMAVALAKANSLASIGQYEEPHPSRTSGTLKEAFRGWS